jgi:hypothetical protein
MYDTATERPEGAPRAWEDEAALRAEHDALAGRLVVRRSAEALRRGAILFFLGLVSFGTSWGLLWDRYGKTPTAFALAHTEVYRYGFLVTGVGAVLLFVLSAVALLRWRRLAREEERLFARLRELRRALGIDA